MLAMFFDIDYHRNQVIDLRGAARRICMCVTGRDLPGNALDRTQPTARTTLPLSESRRTNDTNRCQQQHDKEYEVCDVSLRAKLTWNSVTGDLHPFLSFPWPPWVSQFMPIIFISLKPHAWCTSGFRTSLFCIWHEAEL